MSGQSTIKTAVYGSWKSPISSQLVSENAVDIQEIHTDSIAENSDTVYWSELRYSEGGRYVICSRKRGEEAFTAWTPEKFSARTLVHEYGGGAFFVHNGAVHFSNFTDQRLYVQSSPSSEPEPITPEKQWRYADGYVHQNGLIYCVKEDHEPIKSGDAKEAANMIIVIDPKTQKQDILVSGADFYSRPRVSPDGKRLCWVQWFHPNMPWDTTELWLADLSSDGKSVISGSAKQIVSGHDISPMMPGWTNDNQLLYIADKSDWWNLYMLTDSGEHVNLGERESEIGSPHWVFGQNPYVCDTDTPGNVLTLYDQKLELLNIKSKEYKQISTGYDTHSTIHYTSAGFAYCKAGSPTQFAVVLEVNIKTGETKVIRESKVTTLDKGYFSIPESISWQTTDNEIAHGYYYPPQNKDYTAPPDTLPPLLVKAHGGPTGSTSKVLNLKIQYFTSRGFAVLDVNYRGSTGYGKVYRHKLNGKWGIYDVDDCCSGAQHLAATKKVNPDALCIDGGSAGGYTTLACLTFKDVFKAGASHYGIGDLETLATDTHKFESRYLDFIIAPYSGDGIAIYKERSPINYVENLSCPLILFQGDEDKVVPPAQAQGMYDALLKKKLPTAYVLFQGEQHGFRKAENIQKALDGEFYFYSRVFKFDAADTNIELKIDNL